MLTATFVAPLPIASSCETPRVCSEYDLGHTKKPARDRARGGPPATPGKFETAQGGWYDEAAVNERSFRGALGSPYSPRRTRRDRPQHDAHRVRRRSDRH